MANFKTIREESKLKFLFDFQSKIISFNSIIFLYKKYYENQEWVIDALGSDLPFKDMMEKIFERIIEEFFPHSVDLSSIRIESYAYDISKLENNILDFVSNLKVGNFYLLEFWLLLCKLNNTNLFYKISSKIRERGTNIFFQPKSINWMINLVSKSQSLDLILTYRFKAIFFNQVFINNFNMIPFFIEHINTADTWKYSAELILAISEQSGLKEKLLQIEKGQSYFNDLLNEMNPYLTNISETLENLDLNSPFCVLFSDTFKSIKFKIEPLAYGETCKKYMDYIETCDTRKDKLNS